MNTWMVVLLFFVAISNSVRATERPSINLNLLMSVDWEGFSLDSENLSAFKNFRDKYPEVKIVHFLNAAYFTKDGGVNAVEVRDKMKSVIRPGDELGLHIHAFESLLKAAGVPFRETPTFWGDSTSQSINGDRGHDVPISEYSVEEVRKIIRTSMNILNKNGFGPIRSFRAGGWLASPSVLEALVREGIIVDSSAVSTEVVGLVAGPEMSIFKINKALWPNQNPMKHEPYWIDTPAGSILEIPNNIALADYIDDKKAFELFDQLYMHYLGKQKVVNFHFGFHQETAAAFLPRVDRLMQKIHRFQQQYQVTLKSVTFSDLKLEDFASVSLKNGSCKRVL